MIDNQNITVLGGNGGHGSISFLTARYAPKGGPDGGDGGIGGGVSLIGDSSVWDMSQIRGFQNLQGIRGGDGSGAFATAGSSRGLNRAWMTSRRFQSGQGRSTTVNSSPA